MERQGPFIPSGLVGLACNLIFFLLVAWLQARFIPALFEGGVVLLPFFFFLGLSAAEIPMMIFGLRKLASDPKRAAPVLLILTNGFYVFFAAVYAGLFVVFTGRIWPGLFLSALGIVRFVSSLLFVRLSVESES